MKKDIKLSVSLRAIPASFGRLQRIKGLLFIVGLALLYSFILLRINTYSNQEPLDSALSGSAQRTPQPRIDEDTVKKIQSLQDNSVRVQSLFDQARQNPFQE